MLTQALDDALIDRWLSPGGCADLLALALFLARWRDIPALSGFLRAKDLQSGSQQRII